MTENKELINIPIAESQYKVDENNYDLKLNQLIVARNYFLSKNIKLLNVNNVHIYPKKEEGKMFFTASVDIKTDDIPIDYFALGYQE